MRVQTIIAVCSVLLLPAFSFAQDKVVIPKETTPAKAGVPAADDDKTPQGTATVGSSDICLNETIVIDPGATNPVRIVSGTRVPDENCRCVISKNPDGTLGYSGVGVVTFQDEDGETTRTISKCDPSGASLSTGSTEADLVREETRELLENAVLSTGSLPDQYNRIFEEAGIDTRDIFEGRSREDAARLISDLAFGDSAAKAEAARVVGIPDDQLQRLSANAVRLTPTQTGSAVQVFNSNLSASERSTYLAPSTFPDPIDNIFNPLTSGDRAAVLAQASCAIATIESGSCAGNYQAVGPATRTGNRAYGKYQVMDFNIPSWTREACGRAYTVAQFVNSPECQERVFEHQFGGYIERYGSPENAARVWFGGPGALNNPNASDGYNSVAEYADRFSQLFGEGVPFSGTVSAYTSGNGSPFANVSPFVGAWTESVSGGASPREAFIEQASNWFGSAYEEIVGEEWEGGGVIIGLLENFFQNGFGGSGGGGGESGGPLFGGGSGSDTGTSDDNSIQPMATIIAQPARVVRGDAIIISWSSVGMNTSTSCRVTMHLGSTTPLLVGEGNEGSRGIETDSSTARGVWDFTLRCTPSSGGSPIEKTVSAEVQ